MHEQTAQPLLTLYSQAAALKLLPRTGWLQRGVAHAESVAEHTFGVAVLALLIGDSVTGLDRGRTLELALLPFYAYAIDRSAKPSRERRGSRKRRHWHCSIMS